MQVTHVSENFSVDNVVPYFQSIMDLANDAVWRYECLARLVTLDEHTYLPSEFLFLVERQHSERLLTETIFARSAHYFRDINMSWNVNVSYSDMADPYIHDFLRSQLRDYPNPERVSVEITATNVLKDLEVFARFSDLCRSLGISLFVDHFEDKDDCLETLLTLPVEGIKISAHLLKHFAETPSSADFLSSMQARAKQNRISIIAEHIETPEEFSLVQRLGIEYAQGFYFSQPLAKT